MLRILCWLWLEKREKGYVVFWISALAQFRASDLETSSLGTASTTSSPKNAVREPFGHSSSFRLLLQALIAFLLSLLSFYSVGWIGGVLLLAKLFS
ncbi:hypothetical protein CDAR_448131 [Caerostris darwini]|uniref:Uncharacterized protein n=1 Tax=Caerostris darwini TaxID=1538125 RepID=A0AAV4SCQ1_9ARAC|nr:hypothetical protein CDAR_448131 [Caerostris darwini]